MTIILTAILLVISPKLITGLSFNETGPSYLILPVDSDLDLTCSTVEEGSEITWYYQQTADGQRWQLAKGSQLFFPSIQTNYEGFYSCSASDGLEEIHSNVTEIRVAYLGTSFVEIPSQIYAVEGSTVEFQCTPPDSFPEASVYWIKDGSQVVNMSRSYVTDAYTLVLVGVLQEDKGDYQCVAYNHVTEETRTSLKGELYVTGQQDNDGYSKPVPSIASSMTSVDEGGKTDLLCSFQGVPYPTYQWFHGNGTEVPANDHRYLYQYQRQVLSITNATRDMSGLFVCLGSNVAGQNTINVTLFVMYYEELGFSEDLENSYVFDYGSEGGEVACSGMGSPPLTVQWYAFDGALLSTDSLLSINTTLPRNTTATCRVSNSDGLLYQTTRIVVLEPEEDDDDEDDDDEDDDDDDDDDEHSGGNVTVAEVRCNEDSMLLLLPQTGALGYTLRDKSCQYEGEASSIAAPLSGCGTMVYYNDTHIIYKNELLVELAASGGEVISRGESYSISFECAYKRTGSTAAAQWDARGTVTVVVKGVGSYTFHLDMFTNASFVSPVRSDSYPFRLSVRDTMFFQVSVSSPDEELSLTVTDVVASDSPSQNGASTTYYLLREGCVTDPTFTFLNAATDSHSRRFSLRAFQFLGTSPLVYLHAFVKICRTGEQSCILGCVNLSDDEDVSDQVSDKRGRPRKRRRRRRGAGGGSADQEYHIYQGPFLSDELPRTRMVSAAHGRTPGLSYLWSTLPLWILLWMR